MRFLDVNGVRLACDVEGAGPPIVLLHGLACGRRMWRPVVSALEAQFTTIAHDFRGHGSSDAPTELSAYSEDLLAEDLIQVLDVLQLDRAVLVGFSLGGGVAIKVAAKAPERVAGLVLASVGSGSDDVTAAHRAAVRLADVLCRDGTAAFVESMMQTGWMRDYIEASPRAARHMRALLAQHPARGMENVLRAIMARRPAVYSHREVLERFRGPCLPMLGSRDKACLAPMSFIAEAVRTELVVVDRCAHMIPLESPVQFAQSVATFVRRVAGNVR